MSARSYLGRDGLAFGALRAFGARIVGAALAFGVGVAVARALGSAGAGVYFLAITCASIGGVLGRLGLDQLCVRRIAAAREEGDDARLVMTARRGLLIGSCGAAAVSVALYALAPFLAEHVFEIHGLERALRIAALGAAPLSIVLLAGECLRGLGRAGESQLVSTALPPACTLAFFALGALILGVRTNVFLAAWVAGSVCAAALALLAWRRAAPALPDATLPEAASAEVSGASAHLVGEAAPFLGVAVLTLALPWISTLALAVGADEAQVGVFSIAYRTATLTSFVLVAVNAAVAPRFAALVARGDRASLARTARRAALATGLCALPLVACAWAFPGRIMGLFGAEFASEGRVLAILATGQLVNVLTGSVGALLMMSGHERALRGNLAFATVASIGLHAWLVPSRGVEGAALASAIALATLNIASLVSVRRRLSIDVLPLPFVRAPRRSPGGLHG